MDQQGLATLLRTLETGRTKSPALSMALDGVPVLAANTSDPFAKSNAGVFREIISRKHKLRFAYQTKGGDNELIDSAIKSGPATWYVTLTSDQDERSKQIEPGAPPPTERLALIQKLAHTGYNDVIVGLNPYVPHWWADISATVERLLNAGVKRYWIQPLHLHYKQITQIPVRSLETYRDEIALAKKRWSVMSDAALELVEVVRGMGGMVYGTADSPVDYWSHTREIYGEDKLFPTRCEMRAELAAIQSADPEGRPVLVGLDWLRGWLRARGGAFASLPDGGSLWTSFSAKFRRSVVMYGQGHDGNAERVARHAAPTTRDDFLEALWHIFDYPTPLRSTEWALAMTAGGTVLLTDGQDCPMMVWTRGGWSDGCFEVAEDASNVIQPPKWRT